MLSARARSLEDVVAERLRERGRAIVPYFERASARLCEGAAEAAERFERGGRLFAFGRGPYATDAAHLSVEFVHPVIVGKRALAAVDASAAPAPLLATLATAGDIAIALGGPAGDRESNALLENARSRGLLTFAFPGAAHEAHYAFEAGSRDVHVHQELFELVGHALYETVHVFLEHRVHATPAGDAAFLYPFLAGGEHAGPDRAAIASSIVAKAHAGEVLRENVAARQAHVLAAAARAIVERLARGGRILAFGNGGSATDATDFALDCMDGCEDGAPIAALSLCAEPAILTAIGNDVGLDLVFVRQLIAQSRPADVAVAFSTSGGSKNVVAGLEEARKRGLLTIALLGSNGGDVLRRGLADHALVVESDDVPRIQETQAAIYHVMRQAIDIVRRD